tara:strand:- start:197 stop:631 length:435 start_codon:yes stop_codon:yes gene_type:complete
MAHFAQLNENNEVVRVVVVDNDKVNMGGVDDEELGVSHLQSLYGSDTNWKQTSFNKSFRGNFAGVGHTYIPNAQTLGVGTTDIFICQKPYDSWSLGIQTATWYSPHGAKPGITSTQYAEGRYWEWDEAAYQADNSTGWVLRTYE